MDLMWRHRHKIGDIELTDGYFEKLLKTEGSEPLCVDPRLRKVFDKKGKLVSVEIVEISIIPLRVHRNKSECKIIPMKDAIRNLDKHVKKMKNDRKKYSKDRDKYGW